MMNKRFCKRLALVLCSSLVLMYFTACGDNGYVLDYEDEELIEPVVNTDNYIEASYRTIYDARTYNAVVMPEISEYTYESDRKFAGYNSLPGEDVTEGTVLLFGSDEDVQEKIKDADEELDTVRIAYEQSNQDAYASSLYNAAKEHRNNLVKIYNDSLSNINVNAKEDGTVLNVANLSAGDYVDRGSYVAALGDKSKKQIRCDYVTEGRISQAKEIYAFFDGKRYEIVPGQDGVEKKLVEYNKGLMDSIFEFANDDATDLDFGMTGVVVAVDDVHRDVVCVPNDVIIKDENGDRYVYVYDEDGQGVYTKVQLGLSDGLYTEILSGVKAGDLVLSETKATVTGSKVKVERGDVNAAVKEDGYMYYPSSTLVKNPAENGTTYLKEVFVSKYEQVEKGTVVATIEVQTDSIEIEYLRNKIARETTRLGNAWLTADINERTKQIRYLQKDLNKLTKYSGIVELKAPCDGIVMDLGELKPGDLLDYNQEIMEICGMDQCFIRVKNEAGTLNYNNTVNIKFTGGQETYEIEGTVVTAKQSMLSPALQGSYTLIAADTEAIEGMIKAASKQVEGYEAEGDNYGNGGSREGGRSAWSRSVFKIDGYVTKARDVLLVPKSAVSEVKGDYFVKVVENGEAEYVSVLIGGSDDKNYWIIDGLTEGMEICSK